MKTNRLTLSKSILWLALAALVLSGCAQSQMPNIALMLPIDFVFKDGQGLSKINLLGSDIVYLGSADQGSVYAGAREEKASLVVLRWSGQDNFYSLKGLNIADLQEVKCRVECDITVALVEGADLLIEIRSINIDKVLSPARVIWTNPLAQAKATQSAKPTTAAPAAGQATPTPAAAPAAGGSGPFECKYVLFKKGTQATTLVPLKMRSSPELPENFNSNVISYMNVGEKVEVLADSQGEWINIKKAGGEAGYSKQCTTLNGRFLQPGN
jgi:hypothetical protein